MSSSSIKSDECDLQPARDNKRFNANHARKRLQRTRTSPSKILKIKHLSDGGTPEEPVFKHGQDTQDEQPCPNVKKRRKGSPRRHSSTPASAKMGNANPEAFIQGMHGYQWTDADLAFVYQAKQQKQVQQLQHELREVQETLQAETLRLEQAIAARDKIHSEIFKTLSRELLVQMCKDVLLCSQSSDQLEVLSHEFLQNVIRMSDVQHAIHDGNDEAVHPEKEHVKTEELRDNDEAVIKEIEYCQFKHEKTEEALNVPQTEAETSKSRTTDAQEIPSAVGQREEKDEGRKAANTCHNVVSVKAPEVARVPGRARNAPKNIKPSTVPTKAIPSDDSVQKEAAFKESSLRGKIPPENATKKMAPNETAPPSKGGRKKPQKEISLKETVLRNKQKAPNMTTQKEEVPEEMVLKENSFKKKVPKNASQAKGSSNATQARGRKAAEIPKPQLESDSEIVRRSKRIARKNQSQRETLPH